MSKLILSLCDYTGEWSKPYLEAGYKVDKIDIKINHDVRKLRANTNKYHGILMAPPCTHFAVSGARWWNEKGEAALLDGLSIVDACLRTVVLYNPVWWCLENPVGRLKDYLGPPQFKFNPCDFGDPYTKKTLLWGNFNLPIKSPVEPTEGSKMHLLPPSKDRAAKRSVTPAGFAKAFFEANP